MSGLRAWWLGRALRERALIAAALVLTLAWAGVAWGLRPLDAARSAARAEIAMLATLTARVVAAPPAPGPRAPAPLARTVADSAAAHGLAIQRLEPEGARLSVTLGAVGFDPLLAWLAALETTSGLRVAALDLERRPEPGIVAARLTLED